MIASKYKLGSGVGISKSPLVSFDKALLDAGVGNYNLVRLSSILPAYCTQVNKVDLKEGSLLPVAYSTISTRDETEYIVSTIGVGIPEDDDKVGIIMEYSTRNTKVSDALLTLTDMIVEAFECRGWKLKEIKTDYSCAMGKAGETVTTFACIAEW